MVICHPSETHDFFLARMQHRGYRATGLPCHETESDPETPATNAHLVKGVPTRKVATRLQKQQAKSSKSQRKESQNPSNKQINKLMCCR